MGKLNPPPEEKFFTIDIFRKNTSKYAKLMVEPYYYEFVNIVCKIYIYYLFLYYNISDAREIFIFGEKSRDLS